MSEQTYNFNTATTRREGSFIGLFGLFSYPLHDSFRVYTGVGYSREYTSYKRAGCTNCISASEGLSISLTKDYVESESFALGIDYLFNDTAYLSLEKEHLTDAAQMEASIESISINILF